MQRREFEMTDHLKHWLTQSYLTHDVYKTDNYASEHHTAITSTVDIPNIVNTQTGFAAIDDLFETYSSNPIMIDYSEADGIQPWQEGYGVEEFFTDKPWWAVASWVLAPVPGLNAIPVVVNAGEAIAASALDYRHTQFDINIGDEVENDDMLVTSSHADSVRSGGGDDLISTLDRNDVVFAGTGDDVVYLGRNDDVAYGGDGNDRLYGDGELKPIRGDFLNNGDILNHLDRLQEVSTESYDITLDLMVDHTFQVSEAPGAGHDALFGGAGDDLIMAGAGADYIDGGDGNDVIDPGRRGGDHNRDDVYTGAGADVVILSSSTSDSDESLLNGFAGYAEGVLLEEVKNDAKDALEDLVSGAISSIGTKALGGIVGGVLGQMAVDGAIKGIEALINVIQGESPTTEDIIYVHDFDPREDLMVLPNSTADGAAYYFNVVSNARGEGQPDEKLIEVSYSENAEAPTPFARIFLDAGFQNAIGITEAGIDSAFATQVLNTVIGASASVGTDGLRFHDETEGLGDTSMLERSTEELGLTNLDGGSVRLLGAAGPVVSTRYTENDDAVIFGTNYGDVLSARTTLGGAGDMLGINQSNPNQDQSTQDSLIHGFDGDDIVYGAFGRDEIFGGNGHDKIYTMGATQGASDAVYGENGDDFVFAAHTGDHVQAYGGEGSDTFDFRESAWGVELTFEQGTGGADTPSLNGDYIIPAEEDMTEAQENLAKPEDVNGHRFVVDGFETIRGTHQDDRIDASGMETGLTISLHQGDDVAIGSEGKDQLYGNSGSDTLDGAAGRDDLVGGSGNDQLFGGAGNDNLVGGRHNDTLDGGAGDDRLHGGSGQDTFVFNGSDDETGIRMSFGRDEVEDFGNGADRFEFEDLHLTNGQSVDHFSDLDSNADGVLNAQDEFWVEGTRHWFFNNQPDELRFQEGIIELSGITELTEADIQFALG